MDPNLIEAMLREEIERGALEPGARLMQEPLAARFGVSRQPVRQALERLLAAGLLERRPDRTLAVAGLSRREAMELAGVRRTLEREALRLSLPRLREADLRRARFLADEIRFSGEAAEIEDLDTRFHATLYGACGNARMLQMIDQLRREGRRVYADQLKHEGCRGLFAAQHEALLAACEARATDRALIALDAHLEAAAAFLSGEPESPRP